MHRFFVDPFSEDIFRTKYQGSATDVETYYRSLANAVSLGSSSLADEFYELMISRRFSPGGRILAFGGRQNAKLSLMNCTTHKIEADSLEAISETAYTVMRASSRGQGIGIDLSNLRPAGAPVNNAAKTSTGAISFMEMLNSVGGTIGQEGRRAAMLFSMSVDHPDLYRPTDRTILCPECGGIGCRYCNDGYIPYDFLHVKKVPGRVENANISVRVSDAFMRAVEAGRTWTMEYSGVSGGQRYSMAKTIPARELFNALAASAHGSAEPGLLYWDTSKKMSNSDLFGERWSIVGTNACLLPEATVLTPAGIRTIADIEIGDTIMGKNGWTQVTNKFSTGIKPAYRYDTSKGTFLGTADHPVFEHGKVVEIGQAETVDTLQGLHPFTWTYVGVDPQDVMDGLVIGDGSYHEYCPAPHLYIGDKDVDYYTSDVSHLMTHAIAGVDASKRAHYVKTTVTPDELPKTYDRVIPDRFFHAAPNKMVGFLRGLFSANGYVVRIKNAASRVGLKQSSYTLVKQVQQMLSALGIESYISISKAKDIEWPNGVYTTKESYDLNLSPTQAHMFMEFIGFIQDYKNDAYVPPASNKYSHSTSRGGGIQSVEYLGEREVFDITVNDADHAFWSGGLLVHNCSEEVLDQDGVCNLGSMNLAEYVVAPFTQAAYIDLNRLARDVRLAIEFLDNVITVEINNGNYISIAQLESLTELRRIGLGVMGLADMLAMLGRPYGSSQHTLDTLHMVFETIRNAAYEASVYLAKVKGPAGVWDTTEDDWSSIVEQGFFATLPKYIKDGIRQYGTRNITLLSIAPTGSISNLLGVSSGIEPLFSHSYTRRTRIHGFDELIDYVHPGVRRSRAMGLPDSIWPTAYQVTPEEHLLVQATAQQYVDASIAKTLNFSAGATVDDVAAAYMQGWRLGLKGMAVYVDGSREEQVLYQAPAKTEADLCPVCGSELVHEGGCIHCAQCEWAKCSL